MRKNLLRSAMLLTGLACVLSASAEKRYVQVTSVHQLVDGANYAVGAVGNNANWTTSPLFYTRNGEQVTMSARTLDNNQPNTFADSQVWSFVKSDFVCQNTNAAHIAGPVFSMKGGNKYITQNGTDFIPTAATSTLTMQTAADKFTEVEFVPYKPNGYAGAEALFLMHTGRNDASTRFFGYRAVQFDGVYNRFSSKDDASHFNTIMGDYTTFFTVYLQIASDDLASAARALLVPYVYEEADKWTAHFQDRTYAEELKAALVEAAKAVVSADAYTKTYADLEAETQAYVKTVVQAQVPKVLDQWLDGRIVKLQNQGTTHYMAGHPAVGVNLGTCEEITAASSWSLKKKGGGWIIKNYDQHFVTGTESLGVSFEENEAVVVNITANDDYTVSISQASDAAKYLRAEANDDETGIAEALWSTENDFYAHWKFYGINYEVQFAARQTEKENIAAVLELYNSLNLYADGVYEALSAELASIDCTEPESKPDKVVKLEEISAALTGVGAKSVFDGQHIAFYFDRLNAMVAVNPSTNAIYAPNGTATDQSIWQIKYVADGKFHLYNTDTKRWFGSALTAVEDEANAELFRLVAYSSTNVAGNPVALELSTSNCLHKVNGAGNTSLMKYNNGDAGSAIFICWTSGQFLDWLSVPVESHLLPNTGSNFVASLGDSRKNIPTEAEAKAILKTKIKDGTDYNDYVSAMSVVAKISTEFPLEAYPFGGAFITLTPNDDATKSIKVHYTDSRDANNKVCFGNDMTTENSIWFYKDGLLTNYSNGFRIAKGKNALTGFLGFCNLARDNAGSAVQFPNGTTASAAQLVVDGRYTHIHTSDTNIIADACGSSGNHTAHDLNVALVSELPVEIHSDGWGSFYSPITYSIPAGTGCSFFAATYADESLNVYELAAGTKLAAGTAVLISGTAGTTVKMPLNYCEEGNDTYNGFDGTHVAEPHTAAANMLTYAKTAPAAAAESGVSALSIDANTVINLSKVTDAKPVHTMTITVPESTTGLSDDKSTYAFPIGKLASGIREIVVNRLDGTRTIYDLQGRRLSEPVKGIINIIDGKKVLVK